MRNLLHANLSRLRRDGTFWLMLVLIFACSVGTMLLWGRNVAESLDHYYFRLSAYMGLYFAIFAALFLNTEYSEGTIRNKLAVGHVRRDVYLANYFTLLLASLCFAAAWLAGGCVGIPCLGTWRMGPAGLAIYVLVAAGFTASYCAIYTCAGMLLDRRSAQVSILVISLVLLLAASSVDNALSEPEFSSGIVMTMDGMQMADPEPNPRYVTGAMRTVLEVVMDTLPSGQSALMTMTKIATPVRMLVCDVLVSICVTGAGLALFRRKDLK